MLSRLLAITFIFACCCVAWAILGGTVVHRTESSVSALGGAVDGNWGGPQVQVSPTVHRVREVTEDMHRVVPAEGEVPAHGVTETVQREAREVVPLGASHLAAALDLQQRRKGLLWHPTYRVQFDGRYLVRNEGEAAADFAFTLPLPAEAAVFSDLRLDVGGRAAEVTVDDGRIEHRLELAAGEAREVRVRYGSQGVGTWRYAFTPGSVALASADRYGEPVEVASGLHTARTVRDVSLVVTTNVNAVDFPAGTLSPTSKTRTDDGWRLAWDYGTLVATGDLGVAMPQKLNPGPWVSRVTFFAPVSLFLFFFAVFALALIRGVRLHPMHYFFLGAACFAFHLLLAYLVDVMAVGWAMTVASVVSVALVVSYVRLVAGLRFALVEVGGAQLVYLVAFAATFFLEGATGLAVTLLSVATLFGVMQATGRVDWEGVMARSDGDPLPRADRPASRVAA